MLIMGHLSEMFGYSPRKALPALQKAPYSSPLDLA